MADGKTKGGAPAAAVDPMEELEAKFLAWLRAFAMGDASVEVVRAPESGVLFSIRLSRVSPPAAPLGEG